MVAGPRIESYEWSGGREAMLRWGPEDWPVVVAALPLFEEANRTRAFVVTILRTLAELGIGGVLPDLPGQGESLLPFEETRVDDLRAAFLDVPGTHVVAVRSGALLVDGERPTWLLASQDGPALLRELTRIAGRPLDGERIEIAGNVVTRDLLDDFATATRPSEGGGQHRTVRLASDSRAADRHVAGEPLWRRAEPGNDLALVQTLAADIADWIAKCEG